MYYSITISGTDNNPAEVRVLYPYETYLSQSRRVCKTLSQSENSGVYTGTSILSSSFWIPGSKPNIRVNWRTRGFCVEATKEGTTVYHNASGYIAAYSFADYRSIDSTFEYMNSTSNSFRGVGTPNPSVDSLTYNCLAYAVMDDMSWHWPWNGNPTKAQLDAYMEKSGEWSGRSGVRLTPVSSIKGCDVIYYSDEAWGNGNDGHFARVMAWDDEGYPTVIMSKWGMCELIESTSAEPFSGVYGSAKRFYSYPR